MAGTPPRPHTQASPLHSAKPFFQFEDKPPAPMVPEGAEVHMESPPAYSPLAIEFGRFLYRIFGGGKYE